MKLILKFLSIVLVLLSVPGFSQVQSQFQGTINIFVSAATPTPYRYTLTGFFNDSNGKYVSEDLEIGDIVYASEGFGCVRFTIDSIVSKAGSIVSAYITDYDSVSTVPPSGISALLRESSNNKYPTYIPGINENLQSCILSHFILKSDANTGAWLKTELEAGTPVSIAADTVPFDITGLERARFIANRIGNYTYSSRMYTTNTPNAGMYVTSSRNGTVNRIEIDTLKTRLVAYSTTAETELAFYQDSLTLKMTSDTPQVGQSLIVSSIADDGITANLKYEYDDPDILSYEHKGIGVTAEAIRERNMIIDEPYIYTYRNVFRIEADTLISVFDLATLGSNSLSSFQKNGNFLFLNTDLWLKKCDASNPANIIVVDSVLIYNSREVILTIKNDLIYSYDFQSTAPNADTIRIRDLNLIQIDKLPYLGWSAGGHINTSTFSEVYDSLLINATLGNDSLYIVNLNTKITTVLYVGPNMDGVFIHKNMLYIGKGTTVDTFDIYQLPSFTKLRAFVIPGDPLQSATPRSIAVNYPYIFSTNNNLGSINKLRILEIVGDSTLIEHPYIPLQGLSGRRLAYSGNNLVVANRNTNTIERIQIGKHSKQLGIDAVSVKTKDLRADNIYVRGEELVIPTTFIQENIRYVSPNGNNATAIPGNPNRPYQTISGAQTGLTGTSQVIINVRKGNYSEFSTFFPVDSIVYVCSPGVSFTPSSSSFTSGGTIGYGRIYGKPDLYGTQPGSSTPLFYFQATSPKPTDVTAEFGDVYLTNGATIAAITLAVKNINFNIDNIYGSDYEQIFQFVGNLYGKDTLNVGNISVNIGSANLNILGTDTQTRSIAANASNSAYIHANIRCDNVVAKGVTSSHGLIYDSPRFSASGPVTGPTNAIWDYYLGNVNYSGATAAVVLDPQDTLTNYLVNVLVDDITISPNGSGVYQPVLTLTNTTIRPHVKAKAYVNIKNAISSGNLITDNNYDTSYVIVVSGNFRSVLGTPVITIGGTTNGTIYQDCFVQNDRTVPAVSGGSVTSKVAGLYGDNNLLDSDINFVRYEYGDMRADTLINFNSADYNIGTLLATNPSRFKTITCLGSLAAGSSSDAQLLLGTPSALVANIEIVVWCNDADGTYDVKLSGGTDEISVGLGTYSNSYTGMGGLKFTVRAMQDPLAANAWKWFVL
jgi:hypothetical protein